MRWFGDNWGAPICSMEKQAPTPTVLCMHGCGHDVRPGDNGLLIPYLGPVGLQGVSEKHVVLVDDETHVAYHLVCFFDEIGVRGVTHA